MFEAKAWIAALIALAVMAGMAPASRAQYSVEGFKLGERVATESFRCQASDDFPGYTRCERRQPSSAPGRRHTVTTIILHGKDGASVYLMSVIVPVALDRPSVEREIGELSRRFGGRPVFLQWFQEGSGPPSSVIVAWGGLRLDELPGRETMALREEKSPPVGILIDVLGNPSRSAKEDRAIYRIAGSRGFVFSASFDRSGIGHRRYLAIDYERLAPSKYEADLIAILSKDRLLPSDDYRLWPEVASLTRRLALDTSAVAATEALDRVFSTAPSKKLHSRVWALLPGSTILGLSTRRYRREFDIYGPDTRYPHIRRALQAFLETDPNDPFVEFAHYALGDLEKALEVRPNSPIREVLHYAIGHSIVKSLARDAMAVAKTRDPQKAGKTNTESWGLHDYISSLYEYAEIFDKKPLKHFVGDFVSRADAAKPHFEFVLRDTTAPHADDAAYMLGWLAFHSDKPREALSYFAQASATPDDYSGGGLHRAVRIFEQYPASEWVAIIESDANLRRNAVFWYIAARFAYRRHEYQLAVEIAERALKAIGVSVDNLPDTTDSRRITSTLERINPKLLEFTLNPVAHPLHLMELIYLLHASRDIMSYERALEAAASPEFAGVDKRVRAIVAKYSMLLDRAEEPTKGRPAETEHKDLRQALYLIDKSLEKLPRSAQYAPLREWLHYRKVRIAVAYAPRQIGEFVAAMEREHPASKLLDDALGEQLFAEGAILKDMPAAQRTFQRLIRTYPRGNAVDNAYTWMAILLRCSGRVEESRTLNLEIIRRFPATRHARYAVERMRKPKPEECGLEGFRVR